MSDPTNTLDAGNDDSETALDYDAFLSYAHRDQEVAAAIQKALHSIGRRLGQLRALRVFRDTTNLEANPDLWSKITTALDTSRYLIVVLSPQAAASVWVDREVSYWLEGRGREHLMLVVAEGDLRWDDTEARFEPEQSNAALPVLTAGGTLPAEPLYIDVRDDAPWDFRSQIFRDKVTALAAPIHGKPKDQLASDDLREQQRFRRFRAAAFAGLALLTVIAVVAAVIAFVQRGEAVRQRQEAIRQRDAATATKLTSQAQGMLAGIEGGGDIRAIQQILAAAKIAPDSDIGPQLTALVERQDTIKIIPSPGNGIVAFSHDGRRMLYATQSAVQLWDISKRQPIGQPFEADTDSRNSAAFSPDGHRVATALFDGTVQLRNTDTGQLTGKLPGGEDEYVDAVAFSADGHHLASIATVNTHRRHGPSKPSKLRLWDVDSGQQIGETVAGPASLVSSVAFSPDGRVILSGDADGPLWRWNADTGQPIAPPLQAEYAALVNSVAFSPDGHLIIAGYYEGTVRRWNADTGQPVGQPLTGHTGPVNSVAFSPDGHRIVSGSNDRTVRLWNTDTGQPIGGALSGHSAWVLNVAFSPSGDRILSTDSDGILRVWDPDPDKPLTQLMNVVTVAFSQDGRRIYSADVGDTVRTWDVDSRRLIGQPITGPSHDPTAVAFSPDGRRVVSDESGIDDRLFVWDAATGQQIGPPLSGHKYGVTGVAFSPDGHRIASRGGEDIRLWNADTGQLIGTPLAAATSMPGSFGVTFSPDGHRIAAGGQGGVWFWNPDTGQHIGQPLDALWVVESVTFSPDGHRVVSGGGDAAVRLWNADNGKAIGLPLTGSTDTVKSAVFSLDGHVIVSGSDDGTLRLWNADSGQQIGPPLTGHSLGVTSLAFSPDGRWFVSGSNDATLRLWPGPMVWPEVLCSKLSANMSHKQWHDWVSPDIPYITVCPKLPVLHN
jgi:WD40 repeat protein